ncbi:MAG TPA: M1 family metallopeptidase [Longimicrobium sp.]
MRNPVSHAVVFATLAIAAACAPVAEPIVRPLPTGAALDTAGRPFVQRVAPPPEYQSAVQRGTRSETGAPGRRYWQNRVRYTIRAEVDPRAPRVTGSERIVYINNSPDSLPIITMNFYQNLFRGGLLNTGGLVLTRFQVGGQTLGELSQPDYEANQREGRRTAGYIVGGTLARVILPRALASGDSIAFDIDWNFKVPAGTAPRTGYEDALGGRVLQIAQWYPQIAVYDDVVGQDVTPYQEQGEFYLDYGDWDVQLTLPAQYLVTATGTLQNPEQVLTPATRARLARALQSDSVTQVVTRADIQANQATLPGTNGRVTWRFTANNVRDFAFATSNRYVWDVTRGTIPNPAGGTRNIAVHSMYRSGAPFWDRSVRHADQAIEFLSRQMVPYIYPHISVSEGPIYGMEYPMLVFVGRPTGSEERLYEVIAHEVAHEWVPMMVGQDEAAFPWMDEGIGTFMEALAFNNYFPRADHFAQPRQAYLTVAGNRLEQPLMTHADIQNPQLYGITAYYKPGTLMRSLQATLGDEVFSRGMRTYMNEWMLKHPYPWDFFNTMERVAGRDLDWFWYPYFFRNVTFDQGIASVSTGADSVRVTVRDFGQAPGPSFVTVTMRDGTTARATIPVERWLQPSTRLQSVTVRVNGPVARVELDPEQFYPDVNRRNNVWTGR